MYNRKTIKERAKERQKLISKTYIPIEMIDIKSNKLKKLKLSSRHKQRNLNEPSNDYNESLLDETLENQRNTSLQNRVNMQREYSRQKGNPNLEFQKTETEYTLPEIRQSSKNKDHDASENTGENKDLAIPGLPFLRWFTILL